MKFNTLATARNYQNRAFGLMIVMGDDEKFWVVTRREAAKLEKQGYEITK